jgi:hypothetical protein
LNRSSLKWEKQFNQEEKWQLTWNYQS